MKPDDPENIKLISEGHKGAFRLTDAKTFAEGMVTVSVADGEEEKNVTFSYAELAMSTSISMNGLAVKSVYTTKNEGSSSNGAMTLTCDCNGVQVFVRTAVLRDASGNIVTEEAFLNKTVDVVGIVVYFDGAYQIKVFTLDNITVK
jgi:hypothetical protein